MTSPPVVRRRVPLVVVAAGLAVLVLLAVGAAVLLRQRPVRVGAPVDGGDPACARLAADLPERVGSLQRRATTSRSPAVAAWGDPALVWLCGVPSPGPSPDCVQVSGVDWVVDRLEDGTAFTTYGREPTVQVLVPGAYAPEPLRLPVLSAVVAQVPQGSRRCT